MNPSKMLPAGLAAAAALAATLVVAQPAAAAPTNATWTGASTTSSNWSDSANWGGTAPTSPIGDLIFGDLAGCDAGSAPAGSACYTSTDNLGPATVNDIQIAGAQEYKLYPTSSDNPADTITLSGTAATPNVGITATGSSSNRQLATVGTPITLGAAQQWNVTQGILYLNTIAGSYPLTLDLNSGYVQANDVETQSVTLSGLGSLQLDQSTGSPEKLPAVTVNDAIGPDTALAVAAPNATSGPITVAGTDNNFIVLTDKTPETSLQVNGDVTLDSTSNVEFDIDGNNATPGTDVSRLTTSSTVSFNGAQVQLWQAQDSGQCDTLTPGKSFTVVQGGTLSGQIKVGGKLISTGQSATETFHSNSCTSAAKTTAKVSYGATAITATIMPSLAQVRTALAKLPHPRGHHALGLVLRQGRYGTRFSAPAAGTLSIVWRTTLRTGKRRHTYVIARGTAHARGARSLPVTVRLTPTGRRLLRAHPFRLLVTASDRFQVTGGVGTTFTRRFTL